MKVLKITSDNKPFLLCVGICFILLCLGFYLLSNSVSTGREMTGKLLGSLGRSVPDEQYNIMLDGHIRSVQMIGGFLSTFGGIGTTLFGYLYMKKTY